MDSTKAVSAGDPASAFLNYLWTNYVSSGTFWSMILVVFLLLWIARIFIFDNKNIRLNDKSWFYPAIFLGIIAFVVWLKGGIIFSSFKQYLGDFLTHTGATLFLYFIFGHKLIKWASEWAGSKLNLTEQKP